MKYNVADIRIIFDEVKQIEANSPLEAVKKVFPDYKVTRDYSGKVGDIVVGRYTEQWYGRGYRNMYTRLKGDNNDKQRKSNTAFKETWL